MIKRIETSDGRKLTLLKTTKRITLYVEPGWCAPKWVERTRWIDEDEHNWAIYDGMFHRIRYMGKTYDDWMQIRGEVGREIA